MVNQESFSTPTKWNFDEDRMKAISAYLIITEETFNNFTSYKGISPIEQLYNKLSTLKRAIIGTGNSKDDENLIDQFTNLENLKRSCNNLFLHSLKYEQGFEKFVNESVKFFNEAETTFALIQRICTKNGWYLRKTEDPRYAALKR